MLLSTIQRGGIALGVKVEYRLARPRNGMIPRALARLPASEMFLNLRYGQAVFGVAYSASR